MGFEAIGGFCKRKIEDLSAAIFMIQFSIAKLLRVAYMLERAQLFIIRIPVPEIQGYTVLVYRRSFNNNSNIKSSKY